MYDSFIKYKNMEWSLPLLFQNEAIYACIYKSFKYFELPPLKANLFGAPSCLWAGGRSSIVKNQLSSQMIKKIFAYANLIKSVPTITFTNTLLEKEDLNDKYCNMLLDIGLEFKARFIVHDDRLKDYIKEKDSNAIVVASVIKAVNKFQTPGVKIEDVLEEETNYYNKLLKEYDVIVVRPEYSKTYMLNKPKCLDDMSRVEILINQPCYFNCPRAIEHYKQYSKEAKNLAKPCNFKCYMGNFGYDTLYDYSKNCSHNEKDVKKLIKQGIKHLKLQGRGTMQPTLSIAYLLYSQMFDSQGSNYFLINNMFSLLQKEIDYFRKSVLAN